MPALISLVVVLGIINIIILCLFKSTDYLLCPSCRRIFLPCTPCHSVNSLIICSEELRMAWPYHRFACTINIAHLIIQGVLACYIGVVLCLRLLAVCRIMQYAYPFIIIIIVLTSNRMHPVASKAIITICHCS